MAYLNKYKTIQNAKNYSLIQYNILFIFQLIHSVLYLNCHQKGYLCSQNKFICSLIGTQFDNRIKKTIKSFLFDVKVVLLQPEKNENQAILNVTPICI